MICIRNDGLVSLFVQTYAQVDFLLNVKVLHDVHTATDIAIRSCEIIDVLFPAHLFSKIGHLVYGIDNVNPTFESVFLEVPLRTSSDLNLCFHDKLFFIISTKFACNCVSFLRVVCNVADWNRDAIVENNLRRVVLMKNHVALSECAHQGVRVPILLER